MYRAKNKRIKIAETGRSYELFLIPEHAEHIIKKAADASHQASLMQVIALAYNAYYIEVTTKDQPEPHTLVYGLVIFREKYYQVVGYVTELYGGRFVLETCRVVSDNSLQALCLEFHDRLTTVEFSPDGKIIRHRTKSNP